MFASVPFLDVVWPAGVGDDLEFRKSNRPCSDCVEMVAGLFTDAVGMAFVGGSVVSKRMQARTSASDLVVREDDGRDILFLFLFV